MKIRYQTDGWGGTPGKHHLEMETADGRTVMLDITGDMISVNALPRVEVVQTAMNSADINLIRRIHD